MMLISASMAEFYSTNYEGFSAAMRNSKEYTAIKIFDRLYPGTLRSQNLGHICCLTILYECYHILSHLAAKYRITRDYAEIYYHILQNFNIDRLQSICHHLDAERDAPLYYLLQQAIEA